MTRARNEASARFSGPRKRRGAIHRSTHTRRHLDLSRAPSGTRTPLCELPPVSDTGPLVFRRLSSGEGEPVGRLRRPSWTFLWSDVQISPFFEPSLTIPRIRCGHFALCRSQSADAIASSGSVVRSPSGNSSGGRAAFARSTTCASRRGVAAAATDLRSECPVVTRSRPSISCTHAPASVHTSIPPK